MEPIPVEGLKFRMLSSKSADFKSYYFEIVLILLSNCNYKLMSKKKGLIFLNEFVFL